MVLATAAPPRTSARRLLEQAKTAGCPAEQMRNFAQGLYMPLPWALRFHAAAREADRLDGPDEILIGGSRGPGKSMAEFSQVALDDCQRVDALKCLYLRKVGKKAREQFEDLRNKILFATPHQYNRNEGLIIFPKTESRILVGHFRTESDIDDYLGFEYEVIIVEEATTLSGVKYQALRDCNRTSKPDFRPRMYDSANPGGIGHSYFKKRFIVPYRNGHQVFTRFFPATIDDNPLIDSGYKRKLEENTGWRLRAYRYGDWDIAAGAFFTTYRRDVHVCKPLWSRIPPGFRAWCAMDYGFHHWLVVHLIAEDGDGHLYHVAEHAARQWQIPQHAEAIHEMLKHWGVSVETVRPFVAGQDVFAKRDEGPTIAKKFRKAGIRLAPANMDRVNGWAEMMDRLGDIERGIPPRWTIFETCPKLIDTLPYLEHDPRRPKDVLKVDCDDDGNGGDDAGDCARYGLMASGRPKLVSKDVDFYAPDLAVMAPEPGRSPDEIERMLANFESGAEHE